MRTRLYHNPLQALPVNSLSQDVAFLINDQVLAFRSTSVTGYITSRTQKIIVWDVPADEVM